MSVKFTNNAASTLASGLASSDLTATLVDGSPFPTATAPEWFPVTIIDQGDSTRFEIVHCTSRVGGSNALTIARAQEGTAALDFTAGAFVSHRVTAAALAEILAGVASNKAFADLFPNVNGTSLVTDEELSLLVGLTALATDAELAATLTSALQYADAIADGDSGLKLVRRIGVRPEYSFFGDGLDGDKTVVGSEAIDSGEYEYGELVIPVGTTLTVNEGARVIIRAQRRVVIAGSLVCVAGSSVSSTTFGYGGGGGGAELAAGIGSGGATRLATGGASQENPPIGNGGNAVLAGGDELFLKRNFLGVTGGGVGDVGQFAAPGGKGGAAVIIMAPEIDVQAGGLVIANGGNAGGTDSGGGGGGFVGFMGYAFTTATPSARAQVNGGLGAGDGGDGGTGLAYEYLIGEQVAP